VRTKLSAIPRFIAPAISGNPCLFVLNIAASTCVPVANRQSALLPMTSIMSKCAVKAVPARKNERPRSWGLSI